MRESPGKMRLTLRIFSAIRLTVQLGWHSLEMRRLRQRLAERDEECHALRVLLSYERERVKALAERPAQAQVKVVQFEHQAN